MDRLCACGNVLHGKHNGTCRPCVRRLAAERRAAVLAQLGKTGLTETAAAMSARIGRRGVGRDLSVLAAIGKVARVGDRYFPPAWMRPGGAVMRQLGRAA